MASKTDRLQEILTEMRQNAGDIEASAVISTDGLPMASDMPNSMNKENVAAMSAALLSLGQRASEEQGRGDFEQVFIHGSNGSTVVVTAGKKALLSALVGRDSNLGLVFLEVRSAAEEISHVL